MRHDYITSVSDFLSWHDSVDQADMFRGQVDNRWDLIPSIERYSKPIEDGYDAIAHIEEHLIAQFEKFSMPFRDYRGTPYLEKLVHAQHYGLPTRLLDWTTNPLKALYFAVDTPLSDGVDGCVHAFMPRGWWEGTANVGLESGISAFFPENMNERIVAQEGCFTAFPLPADGFKVKPLTQEYYDSDIELLESVVVPCDVKRDIRHQLSKLGINQRTIYPGLEGVAKWVKSHSSNYRL